MLPLKPDHAREALHPFVPAGRGTICKHLALLLRRCVQIKSFFEDFTPSLSRVVSIDLLHNDSPVIA